jgi:hypothetical protein
MPTMTQLYLFHRKELNVQSVNHYYISARAGEHHFFLGREGVVFMDYIEII